MTVATETTAKPKNKYIDYFTFWSLLPPLITAFLVGTTFTFFTHSDILFILAGLIVVPLWALYTIIRIIVSTCYKCWKHAVSQLITLIFAGPLCFAIASYPPNYVHLLVMYPYYSEHIKKDADGKFLLTEFDWGNTGFVGTIGTSRTLVFDPEDKPLISEPNTESSTEKWHLFGHYYLVIVTSF